MSKNSKNAQRLHAARAMSAARKNGNGGPASTTPKHGKKNAWWQKFSTYAAFVKGAKKGGRDGKEQTEVVNVGVV
jgi:hypothetical protein